MMILNDNYKDYVWYMYDKCLIKFKKVLIKKVLKFLLILLIYKIYSG